MGKLIDAALIAVLLTAVVCDGISLKAAVILILINSMLSALFGAITEALTGK